MPRVNLGMGAGDWIRVALRKAKKSQRELAKEVGRKQQTVNRQLLENRVDFELLQAAFKLTGADDERILEVMKGRF